MDNNNVQESESGLSSAQLVAEACRDYERGQGQDQGRGQDRIQGQGYQQPPGQGYQPSALQQQQGMCMLSV